MDPGMQDKIARLQCWQSDVMIEPMTGGMTNHNFRVTDGSQKYVVRHGDDDPLHMISRSAEIASYRAAFEAGISPELVYTEPGLLVLRYIEGRVLEEADVRDERNLAQIVALLKNFHRQVPRYFKHIPVMFWVFHILRHYQNILKEVGNPYQDRMIELDQIAVTLEKAVGKIKIVFGHNDLLAANLIDDGERIWLIDFDFSGFNSPLFDLSNLASNSALSVDQEVSMLETYFGSLWNRNQWRSYYAMKCASLLRQALWSMVSEIHSELDFNFATHTTKNLQRFDQTFEQFRQDYQ